MANSDSHENVMEPDGCPKTSEEISLAPVDVCRTVGQNIHRIKLMETIKQFSFDIVKVPTPKAKKPQDMMVNISNKLQVEGVLEQGHFGTVRISLLNCIIFLEYIKSIE